jgi:hypothetical protein
VSSWDQNAAKPKTSADQNVPQNQKATFKVAKRFIKAVVFTKTSSQILSDDKYSMVEEACKLAIEDQDHQRPLAGAPGGTPSVCQLPGGPSLKIDLQTREAVSLEFCSMLLSQTCRYWLPPKIYIVDTEDGYRSWTVGRCGTSNYSP